jgi:hypothetical protein
LGHLRKGINLISLLLKSEVESWREKCHAKKEELIQRLKDREESIKTGKCSCSLNADKNGGGGGQKEGSNKGSQMQK